MNLKYIIWTVSYVKFKGALSGGISGLVVVMWISIGSVLLNYPSYLPPTITTNCTNVTIGYGNASAAFDPPELYEL